MTTVYSGSMHLWAHYNVVPFWKSLFSDRLLVSFIRDITDKKDAEIEKDKLIDELQQALNEIKTLRGILPICSHCKNIRDDKGYWQKVESYIAHRSEAEFSHSICPDCAKIYYPDLDLYD